MDLRAPTGDLLGVHLSRLLAAIAASLLTAAPVVVAGSVAAGALPVPETVLASAPAPGDGSSAQSASTSTRVSGGIASAMAGPSGAPGPDPSPASAATSRGDVAGDGVAEGDVAPKPGMTPDAACPAPPSEMSPAQVTFHGSRAAKVVALTFDDGWGASTTRQILAILERNRVNATFFPIGRAIAEDPEVWRAVAAAGFPIGDHTWDHHKLAGGCYGAQLAELAVQQAEVTSILGVAPLPVARPPYGMFDPVTRLAASGAGDGALVLWDVDARDWTGASAKAIARAALAGRNGSIVLMHTFVRNTVAALPRIIAGYRARGFRFVTIGELLGIDGSVPFPE